MRRRTGPAPLPTPAPWVEPIRRWTLALSAAGRREATMVTRIDHVRRFARAHPAGPWLVTGDELVEWAGSHEWARETRRSIYASLRSFYGWGHGSGLTQVNPTLLLPSVKPSPPHPRPAPDPVYWDAISGQSLRERVILRLAGEVGMRRGEIAQVHATDLTEDLDGWSILIHGKGGKERMNPLDPGLAVDVREQLMAAGGGWLFPGRHRGHLSAQYVGILGARALPGHWTLHTLRHRFATATYRIDRDLIALSQYVGHSSSATTERYVKLDPRALRRLAAAAAMRPAA